MYKEIFEVCWYFEECVKIFAMTSVVGTQKVEFSASLFPVTPDTMGRWEIFPREVLANIFINLDLANIALINWTCKEVAERNTSQGERKRFWRIFHLLVRQGSCTRTPNQHGFPLERFYYDEMFHLPKMVLNHQDVLPNVHVDIVTSSARVQNHQLHVVMHMQNFIGFTPYYYISEIDLKVLYPHLGLLKVCFAYNWEKRSIVRIGHDDKVLEIYPAWATDAIEVVFQGITGKWLVVWSSYMHDSKGRLHFLDQETLIEEFCYDLSSDPGHSLGQGHVYIQGRFCVILSPPDCLIKMDGRTVQFDRMATWGLSRIMNMTNFSCQKIDGQMEIRVEGESNNERISMRHIADPFEPIGPEEPKPQPFFLKVLGWLSVVLSFSFLALVSLIRIPIKKFRI